MNKKGPINLDLTRVSKAFDLRLPELEGPWMAAKTQFGQSNPTFIMSGKSKKLVLRKKPSGKLLKSAHMIEREFQVMTALENTAVPVPKMIYLCNDPDEIGTPYFVMEYIEGRSFLDPQILEVSFLERRQVYDEIVKGLANLHSLNPKMIGLSAFGKPGNYFSRQLSRWSRQYEDSKTEEILAMEILRDWLEKHVPDIEEVPRLVHGDWRIDNFLFSRNEPKLIAILDWELSTLGDPRADLASQIMQWSMPSGNEGRGLDGVDRQKMGIPEDGEFIAQYAQYMGLSDLPDLEFPLAFCYFRMAAILQGVKKRALDGNASNPERGLKMGQYVPIFAKKALEILKI